MEKIEQNLQGELADRATGKRIRRWSGCSAGRPPPLRNRGGRHRMHGNAGDMAEEVGSAAVQPNTREHSELGGTIQEVEGERGGGVRWRGAAGEDSVMDATPTKP